MKKYKLMKKLTILQNQVGVSIKNNEIKNIYTQGKHWIFSWTNVTIFDINEPIAIEFHNQFLSDNRLKMMINYVELEHNQVALVFTNKQFSASFQEQNALLWKDATHLEWETHDLNSNDIVHHLSPRQLNSLKKIRKIRTYTVPIHYQGQLYINNKFVELLEPGEYNFFLNETNINVVTREMRAQIMEILGQEILTKDKAQLRINCMLHYQVMDLKKATNSNHDFEKSMYQTIQLSLREYIGRMSFDELMADKDSISTFLMEKHRLAFQEIGIELREAGIKDIILPGDIREIMNKVLIAEKNAQANSIMRREETASTRSLLNTAKLMEENEILWKLKEMEYLEKISENVHSISISGGGNVLNELKTLFSK